MFPVLLSDFAPIGTQHPHVAQAYLSTDPAAPAQNPREALCQVPHLVQDDSPGLGQAWHGLGPGLENDFGLIWPSLRPGSGPALALDGSGLALDYLFFHLDNRMITGLVLGSVLDVGVFFCWPSSLPLCVILGMRSCLSGMEGIFARAFVSASRGFVLVPLHGPAVH